MIRPGKISSITGLLVISFLFSAAAGTNSTPDFKEVYESVRTHVLGMDTAELNRAAVNGFLKELGPKASLVANGAGESTSAVVSQPISKALVFEDEIAYLRVARISDGLATKLRASYQLLSESNQLKGLVLDLRFADGGDYAGAGATVELFALKNPATLDWGKGSQESKSGGEPISVPLIALVNGETRGAAEALAALVRETGAGLLLGNRTAGHALLSQDFPLSDGATLRIATAAVKLNGVELVVLRPDIEVPVSVNDEKTFFTDAFAVLSKNNLPAATNKLTAATASVRRVRLTEAELVRAHKQGLNPSEDEEGFINGAPNLKPEIPLVNDPVLARALDLLKGLAIVRTARP